MPAFLNIPIFERKIKQKMLKTIIVDDEDHVRGILRKFLVKYCPQVKVAAEAGSVAEAHELIMRHHPDLVLLDIQLGDGTGFDLLNKFESPDFKVIFITAHDQYAVQAFRVSAIDFILKPVNPFELAEAVSQAQKLVMYELHLRLEALENNLRRDKASGKKIVIKTLNNIHVIEINTITHCESDSSYTKIFTLDQQEIMTSKPIREYEEMLSGFGFFRLHRSFLINLSHIKRFEKSDGGFVILTGDAKVPVASRKREELIELFDKISE